MHEIPKSHALSLVTAAAMAGVIGYVGLMAFSLLDERHATEQQARIDVENTSRAMQEHVFATVEKIDLALQGIQSHVRPDDLRPGPHPRSEELHLLLRRRLAGIPEASGMHIIDAAGNFLYSAYDELPQANVADRIHFQRQRDDPAAGLVISEPVEARTLGAWSVVFSRRLNSADGRFAGIVNVVLNLDYFQHFYRSLDLGPHGTVVLRDRQLRLLARYPASNAAMGQAIPGHHGAPFIARHRTHAVYQARGQVDGTLRLYSLRQVDGFPLYVFAGIAPEDYLAQWRRHFATYGGVALLLAAIVGGLAWLSRRGMTAQAQAFAALSRSEARLNEAQAIAHIGSWELDLAGNVLTWSDEIYRMFEIDPTRFGASYEAFLDAIHPDDRELVNRAYTESVASRTPYAIDHRLRFADGRIKHVHERCETYYAATGQPLRSVGTVQDITERKLAEEAHRISEERFRTMADYTYDWEYWQGPNQEMLYVTPSCERVTGYSQEEFVANPRLAYDIVHPDDHALVQIHLDDIGHEDLSTVDFRIIRKDGSLRWLAHGCRAVYWSDGRFMGRRASNRDITERKRLETALQELNETLEKRVEDEVAKNREKDHVLIQQSRLAAMGEMVHNIAHQWRQPLNALAIIISNIQDDYDYGELNHERLAESVGKSRRLLDQMSTTIDDFRDFFSPDREPADFDVAAAVEQALFVMEASLHNNRMTLDKRLGRGLSVFGHANQFSQAVLNLIANAKEALQQARVPDAHITVTLDRVGTEAVLTVADNAGGIPEEVLPRIFDPYFTTKEQGSGIGLYMTKMIVERNLHGSIGAGNDGTGALFTVRLPLAPQGRTT